MNWRTWKVEWPKSEDIFSWGRNRKSLQTGIYLEVQSISASQHSPLVEIRPINSKGLPNEGTILQFPVDRLDDLIAQLQSIKAHVGQ